MGILGRMTEKWSCARHVTTFPSKLMGISNGVAFVSQFGSLMYQSVTLIIFWGFIENGW
jgi:hypothetical protein